MSGLLLLVVWWHLIVDITDQCYPHLSRVVTSEDVTDKVRFDLHVYLADVSMPSTYPHLKTWYTRTISSAPRSTPTRMLENHSSSCARPSSGSSTKSASGFSSKMRENCLLSLDQLVIVGVMLRKILKPTYSQDISLRRVYRRLGGATFEIISETSLKLVQAGALDLARKSSISRMPMLYPMRSSCLLTSG